MNTLAGKGKGVVERTWAASSGRTRNEQAKSEGMMLQRHFAAAAANH